MTDPTPISIAPRRARYGAVTLLITGLGTLLGAVATAIVVTPPHTVEPSVRAMPTPSPTDPPIPVPKKEPATTDDGVVEARIVRGQANDVLKEHRARIAALEKIVCTLKIELRAAEARRVQQAAGKHGASARDRFEADTLDWTECIAIDADSRPPHLRSLSEEADSALRR